MISHSKKFIFVHIHKVAGSSIKIALSKYESKAPLVSRALRKTGLLPYGLPYYKCRSFPAHAKARDFKAGLPSKIYDNYFVFAFVRNPWDHQVSVYHYMLKTPDHYMHDLIVGLGSFEKYLDWRLSRTEGNRAPQKSFVTDVDGNIIVDFIGKYESLESDFASVCKKIGVDEKLPHINKSERSDYMSYYTKDMYARLGDYFKEDIEMFGY